MRPDLLTRFDDLYTGGFRWLIDHGIWFTNTHHEHSYTATGPGHYSIGSGQYPGGVGVIGNSFYDRDLKKKVNCVEDPNAKVIGAENGNGRSYARYNTTGLGDWVKSSNPNSKVISIAGKDRAAVFLGGKNPDLALYFNYNGRFISSDYYVDSLPKWANDFNQNLNIESYKDSIWTKSLSDDIYLNYAREDFYQGEVDDYLNDEYSPVFPIGIDPKEDPKEYLMARPWFEREMLKLVKEAVIHEELGQDSNPDMLFIGFSAMDWMTHLYGPNSQEIMDSYIKLDKYLGNFIEFIDETVGLENVLFTLTGDHGGLPLPEYVVEQGGTGGRINKDHLKEAWEWIDEEIEEKFGKNHYHRSGTNYFLNLAQLKKADIDPIEIYKIVQNYLTRVEGIEKVIFKQDILDSQETDKMTQRLKHMIHPHKTPEIFAIVSPGFVTKTPHGTGHGSPYDYDTHVPLIFSRESTIKQLDNSPRATVDIAPTIAQIFLFDIPENCDGTAIKF
jgi:predicted AlkP superfamily pyrophosphatase or phosphodiesterase